MVWGGWTCKQPLKRVLFVKSAVNCYVCDGKSIADWKLECMKKNNFIVKSRLKRGLRLALVHEKRGTEFKWALRLRRTSKKFRQCLPFDKNPYIKL